MTRLVCPRISPEWELAAQLALVKPKPYTKSKIAHREPQQPWPKDARRVVEEVVNGDVMVEFPSAGEHWLVIDFGEISPARAKRLSRKLSRSLPALWFTLDDAIYLRDGVVYQRTGRYNLELVRTNRTRLRRAVRFGFLGDVDDAIPRPDDPKRQNEATQRDR